MKRILVGLVLMAWTSTIGAVPASPRGSETHITGFCTIDGEARFNMPIGTMPQPRSIMGSGPFECAMSIDGGPLEAFTARLTMGHYHEAPSGMIGCGASVFAGVAVIELDRPLPGGYSAILDRFEAASQGPSFWHHGSLVSLGRIDDGVYVVEQNTLVPSEASGEYIASAEQPEQCLAGELAGLRFEGPAVFTLTYDAGGAYPGA